MTAVTDSRPVPMRRTWTTRLLIAAIVLALVAGLVVAIQRGAARNASAKAAKAPTGPLELAAVDVAVVERRVLARELPLSGTVQPLQQAAIRARVSGALLSLPVREGDSVRAGDVLARIEVRNLAAQVDAQAAALEKSRADLALAQSQMEMNAALLADGYLSQNAFEVARGAQATAAANVRAAEAQLRAARVLLDDAVLRAPFDGVVAQQLARVGEKVSPDAALLLLVDLSRMELDAPVPATEVAAVQIGQQAQFSVDGLSGQRFEATVQRINPTTDAGTRSIRIHLGLDNPEGVLRGGMFAQGRLRLAATGPVVAVPAAAIRRDAGVAYVLRLEDGQLRRRDVQLGQMPVDADWIELRDGIEVGDAVLVARSPALVDGVAIRGPVPSAATR